MAERRLLGPLGWRLFAAFTLAAVGAVAVVAVLAAISVRQQTSSAVQAQHTRQQQAVIDALARAYRQAGNRWAGADLTGVQALARAGGARIVVLDTTGGQVTAINPQHEATEHGTDADHGKTPARIPTAHHEDAITREDDAEQVPPPPRTPTTTPQPAGAAPLVASTTSAATAIMVDGAQVGSLLYDPGPAGDTPTWQARAAVLRTVTLAAMIAVLLAAAAALLVSRRISRPLTGLVAAATAVEHGDPDPGRHLRRAPGELGQVAHAFTHMADSLRREDELRRTLVADIAHELRTPITILRGQTEQILDGLAEPDPEHIASLHEEVLRLDHLVEDLSTVAAAQAAALRLERRPTNLTELVTHTVRAMQPRFETEHLTVDVHTSPVHVSGDPQRLTQVLTNLLDNAAKFTPPGGTIAVDLHTEPTPAGTDAVLAVTDTGPGIPDQDIAHVFDRFWRGRSTTAHPGSGIGLAVVAELVGAHGGTVTAGNAPGGGARFTVRLPAVHA